MRQLPYAITPDGGTLIFREHSVDLTADAGDIMAMPLAGNRRARLLIQTPAREMNAELSPDGRWLVYQSDESGRDEIYIRPFPNVSAGKTQVSTNGGTRPLWARSGRELFYESGGALMRVAVTTGAALTVTPPEKLFGGPYVYGLLEHMYDITPDGQRFLMLKEAPPPPDASPPARIVVLPRGVTGG